jgi:N12 class adenine-specific DNA methylase
MVASDALGTGTGAAASCGEQRRIGVVNQMDARLN